MSDRELLELAAKAAGMGYLIWTPGAAPIVPVEHRVAGRMAWHPLTDDGDALRLAVKLGLRLTLPKYKGFGTSAEPQHSGTAGYTAFRDDPMEQTREAIVRAAAEIGRSLP